MRIRRVLIIDDHPLMRAALGRNVKLCWEKCYITFAESFNEIARMASAQTRPHLVILDLQLTGVYGFSGLLFVRALCPKSPIFILSETGDHALIRRSLTLGANGFATKAHGLEDIRNAIDSVMQGGMWLPEDYDLATEDDPAVQPIAQRVLSLSPTQLLIFAKIREGLLNKQIAQDLCVSEATVKTHVTAILRKLGVPNRTQAVIAASVIDLPIVQTQGHESRVDRESALKLAQSLEE